MIPETKKQKGVRLTVGISLILVGILGTFLLIKSQYDHCAYQWLNDLNGFGMKYESVWDCFITRSKGAIVISLFLGSIPVVFGAHICNHR